MFRTLLIAAALIALPSFAHAAEETRDAARNVPRGIIQAVLVSGIAGWVLLSVAVLVIDDDYAVRSAMEALLGCWGCRILTVEGGAEALECLDSFQPQVVIADYRLRGNQTGQQVLKQIAFFGHRERVGFGVGAKHRQTDLLFEQPAAMADEAIGVSSSVGMKRGQNRRQNPPNAGRGLGIAPSGTAPLTGRFSRVHSWREPSYRRTSLLPSNSDMTNQGPEARCPLLQ